MHRSTHRLRLLGAALAAVALPLALVACGDDSSESADESTTTTAKAADGEQAPPEVTDVWARPGTTGGNSAIYMTITAGSEEDHLTKAALPDGYAESVELHETTTEGSDAGSDTTMDGMETTTTMGDSGTETTMGDDMGGGMMSMQQVDEITIDADSTLKLEPGGYHVMLIGLEKDLKVGDEIPVTLTFEHSGDLDVTAEVREP